MLTKPPTMPAILTDIFKTVVTLLANVSRASMRLEWSIHLSFILFKVCSIFFTRSSMRTSIVWSSSCGIIDIIYRTSCFIYSTIGLWLPMMVIIMSCAKFWRQDSFSGNYRHGRDKSVVR